MSLHLGIVLKKAKITKKGTSKSNVASGSVVETLVVLSSNIVQIVAEVCPFPSFVYLPFLSLYDMLMDLFRRESRFHRTLQAIMKVKMWDQPRKRYLLSLVYVLLVNPLEESAIIIGGKLSTCFKFMLKTETCGEGVMD